MLKIHVKEKIKKSQLTYLGLNLISTLIIFHSASSFAFLSLAEYRFLIIVRTFIIRSIIKITYRLETLFLELEIF